MNTNVRDIFANHLLYLLEHQGKSQTDMARDLGVATGTVSSWVNGQKFPRADAIERIAFYFGCRMSTLLEENGLEVYLKEEEDGQLLAAYHAADPALQAAVRKLLDIPETKENATAQSAG